MSSSHIPPPASSSSSQWSSSLPTPLTATERRRRRIQAATATAAHTAKHVYPPLRGHVSSPTATANSSSSIPSFAASGSTTSTGSPPFHHHAPATHHSSAAYHHAHSASSPSAIPSPRMGTGGGWSSPLQHQQQHHASPLEEQPQEWSSSPVVLSASASIGGGSTQSSMVSSSARSSSYHYRSGASAASSSGIVPPTTTTFKARPMPNFGPPSVKCSTTMGSNSNYSSSSHGMNSPQSPHPSAMVPQNLVMARTPPATTSPQNHHPHPSVLWDDTASAHAAVPHHYPHTQNNGIMMESDQDPRRRPPDTVVEEENDDDDDTTSHMSIYSSASWYKSEGSELPIRRYPLQPQRGRRSTAQNEQLSPSRSPARQRRQGGRPASSTTAISSTSNSPLRHRRRTPTTPPTQTTTPATHSTTTTERSHKSESVTRSAQHPKKTDETANDPFLPSETTEGNSSSSSSLFQKSWFSTWTHSKDGDHHKDDDKSRPNRTRDGSSNNEEEEVILVQQQDDSQKETDDEALVIKEETTAAVLASPNSSGGFPYPAPPDPSQFKARPVPKSTYEYHPPHASFNYLRPNPPDAHSLDPPPFKARPLPKTTYEYHGPEPIAAATPTAELEGTPLTSPISSTTTTTTTPRGSASVSSSTKSTTTTSSTGKTRIPTPGSGGSTASTTTNNSSQKRPHTPSSLLRRRGAAASAMTSPSSVLSSSSSSPKTPLSSMRPRSEGTPTTKSLTQKFAHLDQQTTATITNHNKIANTNNKGSRLRSPDGANNNNHSKTSNKNVKEANSSSQSSPSLVDSILLQEAGDDDDDFVDLRFDHNSPKSKHKDRRQAPLDKTKNNNKGSKPSLSSKAEPHKKDLIEEKETPIRSLVPDMEEETTSRTMGQDPPHLNGSVISEHLEDVDLYNDDDDDEDDTDVDGVHIPFDKEEDDEGDFKFRMSYTRFWKNLLAAIILPYLMCRSILEMEYDHFLWELRQQQQREYQQHFPHAPIGDSIPVQEHQEVWFERSSSTMEQLIILEQDDKDQNKDMVTPDHDPMDNDSVSPPRNFPLPKLPEGKRPPKAVYTSQSFVMQSVSFGGAAHLQGSESLGNMASNSETWSSLSMQSQYHVNVHLDHSTIDMDEYDEYMTEEDDAEEDLFDEVHEPSGQHLLVDISNVTPKFLTDMEQLAKSMIALTEQSQLTLLSYHCHEWNGAGAGVSCMGVLLESHLSLHTWPSAGILSLDLFTCGSKSLLPLVPLIQDLFAVSTKAHGNNKSNHTGSTGDQANYSQYANYDTDWLTSPPPVMRWLHKKRGFRGQHYKMQQTSISDHRESHAPHTVAADKEDRVSAELGHKSAGLEAYLLGWMGYQEKKLLVNVQTPFQHVQIYEASLLATVPPLSRHAHSSFSSYSVAQGRPNARGSNKMLYLDGAMRSSLYGLEAYHEALVQPALIAHPAPQRIAIVGGGEGATLREVLKHSTTVTEVVMIEQDGTLVELAREYLREWNDCTQLWDMQQDKTCLASNSTSCFDDPRVKLFVEDAFAWFVERYGRNASKKGHGYEKFDVIILDALELSSVIENLGMEYTDELLYALTNGLNSGGILVSQVGPVSNMNGTPSLGLTRKDRATDVDEFTLILQGHGMHRMKSYSESHGQLMGPWSFRIFFKNSMPRHWCQEDLTTAASMTLRLARRASPKTNSGKHIEQQHSPMQIPFLYFDAPTFLASYQYPCRIDQHRYCQSHTCQDNFGSRRVGGGLAFDETVHNIPSTTLEVKSVVKSLQLHPRKGVFLGGLKNGEKRHSGNVFHRGSYLLLEENVHRLIVNPYQLSLMKIVASVATNIQTLLRFVLNGCTRSSESDTATCHILVDQPQILSLAACQVGPNYSKKDRDSKTTTKNGTVPLASFCENGASAFFDPFADRHHLACVASEPNRLPVNVTQGTELVWDCPIQQAHLKRAAYHTKKHLFEHRFQQEHMDQCFSCWPFQSFDKKC